MKRGIASLLIASAGWIHAGYALAAGAGGW